MADEHRPWWRGRPPIRAVLSITGAVLLLGGFVWLWWQGVPALYRTAGSGQDAENVRLNAVTTTRAALLAGFVGLGALGTFWLNSRVYRITARTFELTERGHLTDRYSKAIEQLGNDNLDVRLGGIYSLEQIAHDSPRDRDQATIVEVLSAFVRVHSAPLYQYKASLPKDAPHEPADEQRQKAVEYVAELDRPPVDVQAAVTVLGRLPSRYGLTAANIRVDLSEAWLRGANLTGARLYWANLTGARLDRANLTGARLNWANLTGARLGEANLTGARLDRANLAGAGLDFANLTGAWLGEADLTGARLNWANLTGARLDRANLTEAHLGQAHLTEARLDGANLTEATHLVQEQVDVAVGDKDTLLPAGLRRPES